MGRNNKRKGSNNNPLQKNSPAINSRSESTPNKPKFLMYELGSSNKSTDYKETTQQVIIKLGKDIKEFGGDIIDSIRKMTLAKTEDWRKVVKGDADLQREYNTEFVRRESYYQSFFFFFC